MTTAPEPTPEPTPEPEFRDVAGLRVPLAMVPSIVAALREAYPQAVDGIPDDDPETAVRAVLREFVASTLSVWAARQVANAAEDQIQAIRAQAEVQANQAYEQARAAARAIEKTPPLDPPIVIEEPAQP